MDERIQQVREQIAAKLWSREPLTPAPLRWLRNVLQLGIVIGQGFARDQLLLRANALTYLTVLSVVPFLALAVTFVGLVGGSDQVLRWLVGQLAAGSPEAGRYLIAFAEKLDFRALGPISGAVLIGTTVLAIGGIERALNAIWGVRKQRSWARRIPDYLAVLVVAPILLGVAIPLRASLESQWVVRRLLELPGFDLLYRTGLRHAPVVLMIGAFSFLYGFLPNNRVRISSALLGGGVAGVVFSVAQRLYVGLSIGAAKYSAIFGGFSAIPLFLVWVYFSWAIVLLGAEVAYAHQTLGRVRREVRGQPAGPAARESIGLAIAVQCARVFRHGAPPLDADQLSDALDVPLRTVWDVLGELEKAGILRAAAADPPGAFQLARPAERVRVADVLAALRGPRETPMGLPDVSGQVAEVLQEVDRCAAKASESRTLQDLLERLGPADGP